MYMNSSIRSIGINYFLHYTHFMGVTFQIDVENPELIHVIDAYFP